MLENMYKYDLLHMLFPTCLTWYSQGYFSIFMAILTPETIKILLQPETFQRWAKQENAIQKSPKT